MCNIKTCIRCGKEKGEDSFTRLKYRNGKVHEKRILTTCLECLDEAKAKRASAEKEPERNEMQPCLYCGKPTKVNKKKKYCSRTCGRYATGQLKEWDKSPRNCKQCGTLFTPKSKAHSCCSNSCQYTYLRENYQHKHIEEKPCVICGKGYVPKNHIHVTCSTECAKANHQQRAFERIGKATCVTCGIEWQPKSDVDPKQGRMNKYCSQKCRDESPEWRFSSEANAPKWLTYGTNLRPYYKVYFPKCKICNTLFTTNKKSILTCSEGCKGIYEEQKVEQAREDARLKWHQTVRENYIPKEITCKECGKLHITQYGDKLQSFCSTKCSKRQNGRIAKATRRARIRGNEYESIDPFKVFARDKWACRICGVKTPKKLRGTFEDNAPELDHIIPIAKGGPHIYENVQCACRKCNQNKSDSILGQIPLFLYSNTA
jgi:hypothetical protein